MFGGRPETSSGNVILTLKGAYQGVLISLTRRGGVTHVFHTHVFHFLLSLALDRNPQIQRMEREGDRRKPRKRKGEGEHAAGREGEQETKERGKEEQMMLKTIARYAQMTDEPQVWALSCGNITRQVTRQRFKARNYHKPNVFARVMALCLACLVFLLKKRIYIFNYTENKAESAWGSESLVFGSASLKPNKESNEARS